MEVIDDLKWRGSINQATDLKGLKETLKKKKINLYLGVDPTAKSIHIGHLIPLTILKRFQKAGNHPIIVIGGGTGMIGDPSGRKSERKLIPEEIFKNNIEHIKKQLSRLFGKNGFGIINNYEWLSKLSLISFLRDFGKLFPVNEMMRKDIIASRLKSGISFTEFTYQIIQAIDFYTLYTKKKVQLQIGGSDQYGNITSGIQLIHKIDGDKARVYGLTAPLLLKPDGTKFGKTAGGTIWLDPKLFSPYQFYQFFYNQPDNEVIKLLKLFTFLDKKTIEKYEQEIKNNPSARKAQKKLAEEVTTFVHGKKAVKEAETISEALFKGKIKKLNVKQISQVFSNVPSFEIPNEKISLLDLLVKDKIIEKSRRRAREDIKNNAISINGEHINEINSTINPDENFEGKFIIIKRGKKKYFLAKIRKDE